MSKIMLLLEKEAAQNKNQEMSGNKPKKNSFISDLCNLDWIKSKSVPTVISQTNAVVTLVDLFSGCGGMTLGVMEALRRHGVALDIKLAVDMNQGALDVYKHNFNVGSDTALNIDINELVSINIGKKLSTKEKNVQQKYRNLDILVAGPPCQGHSNLNNHTRRDDPRNNLYLNAIRFVEVTKPKVAIIENVSTVIHDKDQVVDKSFHALEKMGYTIYSSVINTSEYGLAQNRKRHVQIAVRNSNKKVNLENYKIAKPLTLADYIKDIANEHKSSKHIYFLPSVTKKINLQRIDYLFENNLYDLPDKKRPNCHKNKNHSYKSCYGRMRWDKPAQTITSGFGSMGQGRFVHPLQRRVITPHEAARIQGFPDFFNFTIINNRGDLHTMIANAVPPKVIAVIISSLKTNKVL